MDQPEKQVKERKHGRTQQIAPGPESHAIQTACSRQLHPAGNHEVTVKRQKDSEFMKKFQSEECPRSGQSDLEMRIGSGCGIAVFSRHREDFKAERSRVGLPPAIN